MANTSLQIVEKLIALAAHPGGEENEKIAAARKACEIIYNEKIGLTSGGGNYARPTSMDYQPAENDALKEFYQKLVLFNGKPHERINQRMTRCSLCRDTMKIGDIIIWIPKTTYSFHPACWSSLKVKVAR